MSVATAGRGDAAPPLPTRRIDRCLHCGAEDLRPLPLAYEFRGRFPAVHCPRCGLLFLAVQPAGEGLAELYSAAYFESDFRCGRSDVAYADEAAFRPENAGLLAAFDVVVPPDGVTRRLLEVGCAGGWLLKHAREHGWDPKGVELSADAAGRARALGLDVFHGDLAGAAYPDASFDLVYMGDVLEHVPDCRAVLAEVARVLVPGGRLFLRGPITTHSLARRLALSVCGATGRTIVLREPPYHLWEFRPASLERLLVSTGFRLDSMQQTKIPPGRTHGRKSPLERAALFALDAVNAPITAALNAFGDRVQLVARRVS